MKQITPKQQKILQSIESYAAKHGMPPTYREIMIINQIYV